MISLKISQPDNITKIIRVDRDFITIGRHITNDVVLPDEMVSKCHAVIYRDQNCSYLIRDLSSKHHTIINGKAAAAHSLRPQDKITLGNSVIIFEPEEDLSFDQTAGVTISPEGTPESSIPGPSARDWVPSHQSEARLRQLYEVATAVNSSLDSQVVLQQIMDKVCQTMEVERAFLAIREEDSGQLVFPLVRVNPPGSPGTISVSRGMLNLVLEQGRPILTNDAMDDPRFKNRKSITRNLIRSVACVPLEREGQILGVLYIDNRSTAGIFRQADLDFLMAVGHLAALALSNSRRFQKLNLQKEQLARELGCRDRILAISESMRQVLKKIEQVAVTEVTVLITGESGTGKELVAREVHRQSRRACSPFVAVNCGSIPRDLVESELFGICAGVATGVSGREGFFEKAQGGTLFLDEIGEMPLAQQTKLLRALEERRISRVGADRNCACRRKTGDHANIFLNIRVIAATNKDLKALVKRGEFRQDLLYRLNIFPIHIPPLRERPEDLPLLATLIFDEERRKQGKAVSEISHAAMAVLSRYSWENNNVRELRNVLIRAIICSSGRVLQPADFRDLLRGTDLLPLAEQKTLRDVVKEHILGVLESVNNNKAKAATALGIAPATLFNKLNEYGLGGALKNRDRLKTK